MTIKTHYVGLDGENAVDCETTQVQINAVTALVCALVDPESGHRPADWRWANDPSEARTVFQLILWNRRACVDQQRLTAERPPFAVLTELDGAVVRLEFYDGQEPLECKYDLRSAALRGKALPRWSERHSHAYDPVVFQAAFPSIPPELNNPGFLTIRDPGTPTPAPSIFEASLLDYAGDTAVPTTLIDRRVPQRGWEHEYGVPSYLIGAADVLYHHRKRVAHPDVAVIDAAILRLYGPWIRRASMHGGNKGVRYRY
jgi:hypothetical protein